MSELKPCPFCGRSDIFVEPDETGSGGQWVAPIHVGCKFCQCSQSADDMDEAIAAWNRRATHPQPVTPAVDGESFICYLIDRCEREVISEECLHGWLADFLKNPRYHKPVTPAGGEVGQPWAWAVEVDFSGHRPNGRFLFDDKTEADAYFEWRQGSCNKPTLHALYLHPPVADAALVRDVERYAFLRRSWQMMKTHDAELFQTLLHISQSETTDQFDAAIDAAMNQRGGGS